MVESKHKTTTQEFLSYFGDVNNRYTAEEIGKHFWPDKATIGPAKGGPLASSVSASYFLGRLRKKGFVDQHFGTRPSKWSITNDGLTFLEGFDG